MLGNARQNVEIYSPPFVQWHAVLMHKAADPYNVPTVVYNARRHSGSESKNADIARVAVRRAAPAVVIEQTLSNPTSPIRPIVTI